MCSHFLPTEERYLHLTEDEIYLTLEKQIKTHPLAYSNMDILAYAHVDIRNDVDFFRKILLLDIHFIKCAGEKVRDNEELMRMCVISVAYYFSYASDRLRNDTMFIHSFDIWQICCFHEYIPLAIRDTKEFILCLIANNPKIENIATGDGYYLSNIFVASSGKIKNDRELIIKALDIDTFVLCHSIFKDDDEIARIALKKDAIAHKYLSERLQLYYSSVQDIYHLPFDKLVDLLDEQQSIAKTGFSTWKHKNSYFNFV